MKGLQPRLSDRFQPNLTIDNHEKRTVFADTCPSATAARVFERRAKNGKSADKGKGREVSLKIYFSERMIRVCVSKSFRPFVGVDLSEILFRGSAEMPQRASLFRGNEHVEILKVQNVKCEVSAVIKIRDILFFFLPIITTILCRSRSV